MFGLLKQISGQDKSAMNTPALSSSFKPRPHSVAYNEMGVSPSSMRLSPSCRFSEHRENYSQGDAHLQDIIPFTKLII